MVTHKREVPQKCYNIDKCKAVNKSKNIYFPTLICKAFFIAKTKMREKHMF